jgi:hypothetical protein
VELLAFPEISLFHFARFSFGSRAECVSTLQIAQVGGRGRTQQQFAAPHFGELVGNVT